MFQPKGSVSNAIESDWPSEPGRGHQVSKTERFSFIVELRGSRPHHIFLLLACHGNTNLSCQHKSFQDLLF